MAHAQSWDDITRNSDVYLYGDGHGATVAEADKYALDALISQISVAVSSDFAARTTDVNTNGQLDSKSVVRQVVQTYSSATLTNTTRMVLKDEPDAHVGRFIKRSELNRIFEGRLRKVKEYMTLADSAEKDARLDDALRYYYWSLLLVNSTMRPNEVVCNVKGKQVHPATWIPDHMNGIFSDIESKVVSRDGSDAVLRFTYRGEPVTSLDYTYWDGRDWSNIYSARNGTGVLELLPGASTDNIRLKYEFAFRGEAENLDKDVASVQNAMAGQTLKKAYANVSGKSNLPAKPVAAEPLLSKSTDAVLTHVKDDSHYAQVMAEITKAIGSKNYMSVQKYFTEEGWDMYLKLVTYGYARLVGDTQCKFYKHEDKVIARSIPMSFSFRTGARKSFVEDVVFTFDAKSGKVECLAFSLDKEAVNDVLGKHPSWPEEARQNIVMFLENYKTAYALKRLDYIESIFDDNAVIIVGHVTKSINMRRVKTGKDQLPSYVNHPIVKNTRYDKQSYIKHLGACFRNNEYVNIRFGSNKVKKAGTGEEIYGIQIKQDYYSSNYGDQGYLFLRVDLTHPDEPVISVRTWQPQPDPVKGIYGLEDF